jgi:ABC-type sugar transport system ATPase subunit
VANDAISLDLQAGEVLALLGENGAGKSTLMSILFGHYVADEGRIEVFGAPLPPGNPKAALAAGVGMVHQHFTLADNLSVLDNVMMGTEPLWRPGVAPCRGARPAARRGAALRPAGAARREDRQPVGRRAPARGNPQGAVPRRPHPDPGRADRRAHAAGERGAVRHARRRWWRRACR